MIGGQPGDDEEVGGETFFTTVLCLATSSEQEVGHVDLV